MNESVKPPSKGVTAVQPAPQQEDKPTVMERVGGAVDGAAIAVTGGPFGLLLDPSSPFALRGDPHPSAPFKTWGYIFPAGGDDDGSPSPGETPGPKKGQGKTPNT